MYDNDSSGSLDLREFTRAMVESRVKCDPDEINFIYEAIDNDKSGLIQYKELLDVIFGVRKVDFASYIAKRRHAQGLDSGIDSKVQAEMAKESMQPNLNLNELNSAGSVSGLSQIMKRSEDESKPANKFLDESESFKILSEL